MLRTFLVSLVAIALVTACAGFGSFTFTEESGVITIEGRSQLLGPLTDLFPAEIPLNVDLEQELAEQDASGARSVHLNELYFELVDDSVEENFDFIDEITLEISGAGSSDLETREIAWARPVPEGEARFSFDVDEDFDIKPYAEAGLRLRTRATGSAPRDDARLRVVATFRVRVL